MVPYMAVHAIINSGKLAFQRLDDGIDAFPLYECVRCNLLRSATNMAINWRLRTTIAVRT